MLKNMLQYQTESKQSKHTKDKHVCIHWAAPNPTTAGGAYGARAQAPRPDLRLGLRDPAAVPNSGPGARVRAKNFRKKRHLHPEYHVPK